MADFLLAQSTNPETGQPLFDLVIGASQDFALVSGVQLLGQNVLLFLLTPLGSAPMNPSFGTSLSADIGQPLQAPSVYQLALAECVSYYQAQQATSPVPIPLDEQLASIDTVSIVPDPATLGLLRISFVVHAASGASTVVSTTA